MWLRRCVWESSSKVMAAESVGVCFPVGKLFGIHGNFLTAPSLH